MDNEKELFCFLHQTFERCECDEMFPDLVDVPFSTFADLDTLQSTASEACNHGK